MPVTAKLSKLFYDRLGEAIANELVDWFNQVDATYRSDLREVNELNFARFDAKMEQRLAQAEAKMEQRLAQAEAKMEQRLAQHEVKVAQRLAELEMRMERRLTEFRDELKAEIAVLRGDIIALDSRVDARLQAALREQTRFFFVAWAATMVPIIGLWFR